MAKPVKLFLRRLLQLPFSCFMAQPGESSFRRILLSRILLLSVPVLLVGEYVTYRKARSSLLETARQNLTESAIRKGDRIGESIAALQANLVTAAQASVLQNGSAELSQKFLQQLKEQLPTRIDCIQLTDLKNDKLLSSTCGNRAITKLPANLWPTRQTQLILDRSNVRVATLLNPQSLLPATGAAQKNQTGQLELVLSVPVYNRTGQLSYALSIQSGLYQQQRDRPGSLYGSTVVIDQNGIILEHPIADRVGRHISQEADAERLQSIVRNAIAGQNDFLHVFDFENQGVESVVGYTAISSPVSTNPNDRWIILAVASLDNALFGLEEIKQVMLNLILGLLAANLLATLYLSRDLARPLEKLGEYALNVQGRGSSERTPHNLKIREFNQLALALDAMVERLTAWAEEVETAWKEAQAANKLKSEFLANTSHELRTPLNAIIGCIRLVKDGCCDDREEEMDFLDRADDAAIHLLNIINDILDLSKIEAGTLSVVTEPLDLRSLLAEVIHLQMVHIEQKGLQLHWNPPADAIAVQADPAKLKQVLLNVVGNAIKFTDAGSITIMIQTKVDPDQLSNGETPWVFVTVQDTGIGVAPDQQQKLFRPFVMADGTRTRKHGGTGLGLAISRKLMELMGGTISLHSDGLGKGTTLEIAIPMISSSRLSPSLSNPSSQSEFADTNGHGNPVISSVDKVDPPTIPRTL
jgi:two-component system, NarL family, sensor histidine kinase BarA